MLEFKSIDKYISIHSYSGRVEFIIFYEKIQYLVDYFNQNKKTHIDKKNELSKEYGNTNFNTSNLDLMDPYDYRYELMNLDNYFMEIQVTSFVVLFFSEFEKLIDNLLDCKRKDSVRLKNISEKLQYLCSNCSYDGSRLIELIDYVRNLRNFLIHEEDHWVAHREYKNQKLELKMLTDEFISDYLEKLIISIIEFEEYVEKYYYE